MTSAPIVWPFLPDTVRVTPGSRLTIEPATRDLWPRQRARSNVVCDAAQGAHRVLTSLDPRRDQRRSRPRSPRRPRMGGRHALRTSSRPTGAARCRPLSTARQERALPTRRATAARPSRGERLAMRARSASHIVSSRRDRPLRLGLTSEVQARPTPHASAAAFCSAQRLARRRRAARPRLRHGARVTAVRPPSPPDTWPGGRALVLLVRAPRPRATLSSLAPVARCPAPARPFVVRPPPARAAHVPPRAAPSSDRIRLALVVSVLKKSESITVPNTQRREWLCLREHRLTGF